MAEGTQPEASTNNDDLFGESTTAVAEPEQETGIEEPSGEVTEEVATEPETTTEVTEEAEEPAAAAQSQADPELDAFLAKKKVDRDEFLEYMERYRKTPADLKADPQLKFMLLDKINADHRLAELGKPKAEEPKQEEPQKSAVNPADHVKNAIQSAGQYNDPAVLKGFREAFQEAGEKNDPDAQFAVLAAAANNLVETRFAQLMESHFENALEKKFPGFGSQWNNWKQANEYGQAWEAMRKENPQLPESFAGIEQEALKNAPWIAKAKDITPQERLQAYVRLAAAGKPVTPETVEKAATKIAEKKLEQKATAEKAKGLGAGQTKGTLAAKQSGNDDIFGPMGDSLSQKWTGKPRQ